MRFFSTVLLILCVYSFCSANQKLADYKVPILFEPNHGQFESDVDFVTRTDFVIKVGGHS
jgi:hypothetical protein